MNKTYLLKLVNDVSGEFDWVVLRLKDDTKSLTEVIDICAPEDVVWHIRTELLTLTQTQEVITKYEDNGEVVTTDYTPAMKCTDHEHSIAVIRVTGKTKSAIAPSIDIIKYNLQNCPLLTLKTVLTPDTVKLLFNAHEFINGEMLAEDNARFLTVGEKRAESQPIVNFIQRMPTIKIANAKQEQSLLKLDLNKIIESINQQSPTTVMQVMQGCVDYSKINTIDLAKRFYSGELCLFVTTLNGLGLSPVYLNGNCFVDVLK